MTTEKYIWPEPCVCICPTVFWLWTNTPVRVVQIYLSGDPNHGSDLSHVWTEHLRTVVVEKDLIRSTPWHHQYVRTECSEQGSGANYQTVYWGQVLKQKWSSDPTPLLLQTFYWTAFRLYCFKHRSLESPHL